MIDLATLQKSEIIRMAKWKCPHKHTGIEHQNCWAKYKDILPQEVGYWDIESTGLNANFDFMLSYCFIDSQNRVYGRAISPKEALDKDILDKNLIVELCEDMRRFERIWVWYGKDLGGKFGRHDTRFSRTRALKWGAPFPKFGEGIFISDGYDIAKTKLKLHSNRLQAVCNFLKIPAKTHPLDEDRWLAARLGDKDALKWIWEHNKEDSISLKMVMDKIGGYCKLSKVSI